MMEYRDMYGNSIIEGDIISMPHVLEKGYEDKILHGYYISRVTYDKNRDKLVTDCGNGFGMAYGVVRLNVR